MVKKNIKLCKRLFFYKMNKNTQRKPELKFSHIRGYDINRAAFQTL